MCVVHVCGPFVHACACPPLLTHVCGAQVVGDELARPHVVKSNDVPSADPQPATINASAKSVDLTIASVDSDTQFVALFINSLPGLLRATCHTSSLQKVTSIFPTNPQLQSNPRDPSIFERTHVQLPCACLCLSVNPQFDLYYTVHLYLRSQPLQNALRQALHLAPQRRGLVVPLHLLHDHIHLPLQAPVLIV